MYKYFIGYKHAVGFGRCEITRDKLITGIKDIEGIEVSIEKSNNLTGVIVLNYRLFDE